MKKQKGMIFIIISLISMTACGRNSVIGIKGDSGAKGDQGFGAGAIAESVQGLCGLTDGVRLITFQDKNNDGFKDSNELITAVTSICGGTNGQNGINGLNGLNGQNGQNGLSSTISISSSAASCGNVGGHTLISTVGTISTSFPICNGAQGIQGLTGLAGNVVTPVKFCNTDTSSFPEYGLYVDGDLYAVYWGSTPSSGASQAFLTKLSPGRYSSTGGNNCAFTVNSDSSIH